MASNIRMYLTVFIKWVIISALVGISCGLIGSAFHICIDQATNIREAHPVIIGFMPLAGLLIAWMYKASGLIHDAGTNHVISAVRRDGDKIPGLLAPVIFAATVITHLFGGSAGREGAALQLGGAVGTRWGIWLRLGRRDMHTVVLCGMSGLFAALFGTPLTAAVFALEVVSVGVMYYSGLIPCLLSALCGYYIASRFGIKPTHYIIMYTPSFQWVILLKAVIIAICCAALSIIFCEMMKRTARSFSRIASPYIRIALGAAIVVALTLFIGNYDYNGAGGNIIKNAIESGVSDNWAFFWKMLFTAVTIGCGFRGGEIVPTFFIGATFGCTLGGLIGLDPSFGAALGLVALFCCMVNCPIASIILSVELFGANGILYFASVCAVGFMLSGYRGLYSSQKIVYSKLGAEYIDRYTK